MDHRKLYLSSSLYSAVEAVKTRVLDFITADLLVDDFTGLHGDDGYSAAAAISPALELWTHMVSLSEGARELRQQERGSGPRTSAAKKGHRKRGSTEPDVSDEEEQDGDLEQDPDELSSELQELMQTLFACIEAEGATVGSVPMDKDKSSRDVVYETATMCALDLIRLKSVGHHIQVDQWHRLGWALLNPKEQTRARLLERLNTVIQTSPVHQRFLVYPCLFATDETLEATAQRGLLFAVKRLRSTHESLCGSAIATDSDELRAMAEMHMPEGILPHALHLLSYHPEFPESSTMENELDKKRCRNIVKNLRMIHNVLMSTLPEGTNNLSFLLKQVNMIDQHYEDATDADNIGLNFVTRLCAKLLSEKIKTAENVAAYPGDVHLPSELFSLRKATRNKFGALDDREGLEEADVVSVVDLTSMACYVV